VVKTHFPALAVGTRSCQQGKPAGIAAAAPAVIPPGARQKLVPAVFAQVLVGFADAFATVDANGGPEELVEALKYEGTSLS
jgi:hypothetical protein